MRHGHYDVVVIGGGPAGAALSMFLVRKGYRVLVLEREKFPRFHVGESLLPGTQLVWEKLGLAEKMQHLGNTFKYAGEFRIGLDPNKTDYEYSRGSFNTYPQSSRLERPYSYQVDRAEFDQWLLNQAREAGVLAFEEAVVKEVLWEGDRATGVRWKDRDGVEYSTQADFVADCSGRHAMISRARKFLQADDTIKTSAVFGQFRGVQRDPGVRQGYFNGYFLEHGWMWFIPLHSDVMSVGVVMNKPGMGWWGNKNPEEILLTYINRYKFIKDRFMKAEQISKVRTLRGLPYTSSRCAGDGWCLVGDSNFFVDPLYSSGVHIAFSSAEKASEAIDRFLKGKRDPGAMAHYERWAKSYAYHIFTTMGILYKMLPYYRAMHFYVTATGKYGNQWDGFVLRHANAWGTGNYDDHRWSTYCMWSVGVPVAYLCKALHRLSGHPGWQGYEKECSEPPLTIPKAPEFFGQGSGRKAYKPATAIQQAEFMEHWAVPMDSSDERGLPGSLAASPGDVQEPRHKGPPPPIAMA